MARTRNIKPGFFDNDELGALTPLTRLLFIGLWCIADREGRLGDRPRRIKKTLLGYDDVTTDETSGMLQQLHDKGFIIRYKANDEDYIQIVNFTKHQNPHMKEKDSEIPPPPGFITVSTDTPHSSDALPTPPKEIDVIENAPSEENNTDHPSVQEARFNAFWDAYPNKKAKQNALKAWKKIKPNAELFEKIMKAVELQKRSEDWQREGGRFIPHPATWINGGRWDDVTKEVSNNEPDRHPSGGGNVTPSFQRRKNGSGTPAGFKSE